MATNSGGIQGSSLGFQYGMHASASSSASRSGVKTDLQFQRFSRSVSSSPSDYSKAKRECLTSNVLQDEASGLDVQEQGSSFVGLNALKSKRQTTKLHEVVPFGAHRLNEATQFEKLSLIRDYTKSPQLVNCPDHEGNTPLHLLGKKYVIEADGFYQSALQLLLTAGARVDCVNDQGDSELHCFVRSNAPPTIRLLFTNQGSEKG